jgi:hypothetical protein
MGGIILSDDYLTGMERHKYSTIDHSLLDKYIGNPFWNRVVTFVPLWVAPNVVWTSPILLVYSAGY